MFGRSGRRGRPAYPDVLTPAEWRVLEHLREGRTNAEIAVRLGISPDGVKFHVSNMLAKLELPDRRALAQWQPSRKPSIPRRSIIPALAGAAHALSSRVGLTAALVLVAGAGGVLALSELAGSSDRGAQDDLPAVRASMEVTSFAMTQRSTMEPQIPGHSAQPGEIHREISLWYRAPDQFREEQKTGDPDGTAVPETMVHDSSGRSIWLPGTGTLMRIEGTAFVNDPYAGKTSGWPLGAADLRALVGALAPFSHASSQERPR